MVREKLTATPPFVLVIAGSDSSGGAGIARDIETLTAHGVKSCLAITAITVQTHKNVAWIELSCADLVASQIRAALEANPVSAIKIGMLGSVANIRAVAQVLRSVEKIPTVLDPVLASSSGSRLLDEEGLDAMLGDLVPLCTLITPNLPELALLTDSAPAQGHKGLERQAATLLARSKSCSVLVKGGHSSGTEAVDILFRLDQAPQRFAAQRHAGTLRGTGCMLSSAIAAHLAKGAQLHLAVAYAKKHVSAQFLAMPALDAHGANYLRHQERCHQK